MKACQKNKMRRVCNVEVIRVSLWPFESTDAAVRGILAALVRGLGRQVGLLGLSGLADQYVSTIERVGGRWGSLARLLRAPDQPAEVLKRVEAVARAIAVRYVLWIEDLERFALDAAHRQDVMATDSVRLGPIRALLYLLDRCEHISVVVADCSLDSRFDLDKVARFIERVPSLLPEQAGAMFRTYRDACLQEAEGIIDPVHSERRKNFLAEANPLLRGIVGEDPARMVLETALSVLLATPRALKTALRVSHEVWQRLAGEIDLDDVLVMSTIRAARPRLFAFIDRHIERFRDGFRWRKVLDDEDPKEHPVYREFERLIDEKPTDRQRAAVRTLVRCVFPAVPSEGGSIPADRVYVDRPQGLAGQRHVDYWRRYLSIPDISEQESDQAALTAILAWKKRERNDLVERVIDGNRSDQIESFVNLFEGNELCRLLEEVATAVSAQSPACWDKRGYAPGMVSLRRMMQNKLPDPDVLASTISELIARVVPFHLPLVNEIAYWFSPPDRGAVIDILGDEGRRRLKQALRRALSSTFGPGDGKKLLAACQNGGPLVLRWLSHHLVQPHPEEEEGLPFEGWPELAEAMLDAAETDPSEGVAYVIPFISGAKLGREEAESGTTHAWIGTFDEAAARRLFDFDRLLPLLADTAVPGDLEPQFSAGWNAAQRDARRIQQMSTRSAPGVTPP